jgi:predicted dehydrogenase
MRSGGSLNNVTISCVDTKSPEEASEIMAELDDGPADAATCRFEYIQTGSDQYHSLLSTSQELALIVVPDKNHFSVVEEWLQETDCPQICVEKPLCADRDDLAKFLGLPVEVGDRVFAVDHYRNKLHSSLHSDSFRRYLLSKLGEDNHAKPFRLTRFRFFCIEDFSGTDDLYLRKERIPSGNSNCPIKMVDREDALQLGMTFDLLPHMFAVLMYFGELNSFGLEKLWAAKYTGVNYDVDLSPNVDDTFVALHFTFDQGDGVQILGEAYAGKGIRGVREFADLKDSNGKAVEIDGDTKVFELEDIEGEVVQIFMKPGLIRSGKDLSWKPTEEFKINDPFEYLVSRQLSLEPTSREEEYLLRVSKAAQILEKIFDIKERIPKICARNPRAWGGWGRHKVASRIFGRVNERSRRSALAEVIATQPGSLMQEV